MLLCDRSCISLANPIPNNGNIRVELNVEINTAEDLVLVTYFKIEYNIKKTSVGKLGTGQQTLVVVMSGSSTPNDEVN